MPEARLEEIDFLTLMATREPWSVEYLGQRGYPQRVTNAAGVLVATFYEGTRPAPNAEFTAAARVLVPELVAEVRRPQAVLARVADYASARAADGLGRPDIERVVALRAVADLARGGGPGA
jgi:hypothetical protein